MTRVWESAEVAGGDLLVLLALADHSDEKGVCWPGIDSLAQKSRMTPRHVKRIVKKLREGGFLDVEQNAGEHGTNRYRITVGGDAHVTSDKLSRVTSQTQRGDICSTKGVTPMSPESSLESSRIINRDPLVLNDSAPSPKSEDLLLRARQLFRMRSTTPLDRGQESAWKRARNVVAATSEHDWQILEWFYRQAGEVVKYRRRDLSGCLNHWNAEISKADEAAHKCGFTQASTKQEPTGWQEVFRETQQKAPPRRWDEVSETVRDGIREELIKRKAA